MRRKERNVERDFEMELVFAEDPAAIPEEMSQLIELMRNEEAKTEFLTTQMEKYLIGLAEAAYKAGRLNLASLMLDGTQAATYLNFIKNNKLWSTIPAESRLRQGVSWLVLLTKTDSVAMPRVWTRSTCCVGTRSIISFSAVDRQVVQIVWIEKSQA